MFWRYNVNSSSETDAVLANEAATIYEVMDAEDIINQCKGQNKALIDFLLRPNMMEELVSLITKEPSMELDQQVRFKYPNIACELLTSDIPAINERLAGDEVLLEKFYGFLDCDPPLNPLLASYFSRIMGALIAKKTEQNWLSYQFTCLQVLDFLKAKDNFISLLLKHLGTSAIMDLMLKLMTQVESVEMKQNILNWLDSRDIMQKLVRLLNPEVDSERHDNVAQLLCDFIKVARETQRNATERIDPDPLLNSIESLETISLLLENMFSGDKCESAIVGGIQVLLALLDYFNVPSYNSSINDEAIDIEHRDVIVRSVTSAIHGHMDNFNDLLSNPPKKPAIVTTVGTLNTPLGKTRLQVIKLFAALISTRDARLLNDLIRMDSFNTMLGLFFEYQWNNFLHAQVENCLIEALRLSATPADVSEGDAQSSEDISKALSAHLLVDCNFIGRIIEVWKDNDRDQKQSGSRRRGYMGHLITMLNKIVNLCTTSLGKWLEETAPETAALLKEFKDSTLQETNAVQESLLGGVYPNASNEESEEYGDVPFAQEQSMFSNYQLQNLSSHCVDGYSGFNDETFNDNEENLRNIEAKTGTNFDVSDSKPLGQPRPRDVFEDICAQTMNTLEDGIETAATDEDDEEEEEEEDDIFGARNSPFDDEVIEKTAATALTDADKEKGATSDVQLSSLLDVTNADPWGVTDKSSGNTATAAPDTGDWANFSAVKFEATFDDSLSHTSSETKISTDSEMIEENAPEIAAEPSSEAVKSETPGEPAKTLIVPEAKCAPPETKEEPVSEQKNV